MDNSILIGIDEKDNSPVVLNLKRANRHGLIAGATGTGKTVTLQLLAESLSRAGVPVFAADVKGDLSGASQNWQPSAPFAERAEKMGISDYKGEAAPVVFWDLFGESGHPIRTTIFEMGPKLLSRLMDLTDAQSGTLTVLFQMADDKAIEENTTNNNFLLDLKDLNALLDDMYENAAEVSQKYGLVSKQSISALKRKILELQAAGADKFFAEPALDLNDFIKTDASGRGIINMLDGSKLMASPMLYSTFLLWLLSELFETLPEVGDPDKPKLVFFFDEAHLLFRDAPKALLTTIEQVVRLIRSKGVGIYFVTQNPQDIPETVLAQLGNRIQHALRAYTPSEMKAVKVAAQSFRANPDFDTEEMIGQLGLGEALVSTLDEKGVPTMVEKTMIAPPRSRVGPATKEERAQIIAQSPIGTKYDAEIDRVSAYEVLNNKVQQAQDAQAAQEQQEAAQTQANTQQQPQNQGGGLFDGIVNMLTQKHGRGDSIVEAATKSFVREASTTITRQLVRGIFGNLLK